MLSRKKIISVWEDAQKTQNGDPNRIYPLFLTAKFTLINSLFKYTIKLSILLLNLTEIHEYGVLRMAIR